jgi:glutaredoxin-related protein
MIKKILFILFLGFYLFGLVLPVQALEKKATLYFFYSQTCPHCAEEKIFLEKMAPQYPELEIKKFDLTASQENLSLFKKVGEKFDSPGYVPFTVVGEDHIVGFLNEEITGKEIEKMVECALETGCQDLIENIISSKPPQGIEKQSIPDTLKLPFLGEIKTRRLSLPILTLIISLLDGFNPCAMWVLLFLISLLLGIEDKKRRWALGIIFIMASSLFYFFFLTAWLNLFLFLGFIFWIRIMIGLLALFAGGYNLRDWWVNREGGCQTVGEGKRERIFAKIRQVVARKHLIWALIGMVGLAFAVNLIELVCSAGLPAIYTQILSLTKMPRWQYYLYLLEYIFFFMLDDLAVFSIAMVALRAVGIEHKYARFSKLIGGGLMLIIGILLLFKPELLTFS